MELVTPQLGLWPMDKPQRNYSLQRTHARAEETSQKEGAVEEPDEK